MKVLIDALGAPSGSGGMQAYATELILSWAEAFPQDTIYVAGGMWMMSDKILPGSVMRLCLPDNGLQRLISQWLRVPRLAQYLQVDAMHSISPAAARPKHPSIIISNTIHDWRHVLRPNEFSLAQRGYRMLYPRLVRGVDVSFQISSKTLHETRRFAPRGNLVLALNGTDHARRWAPASRPRDFAYALTFGHHANKRPELVVAAFVEVANLRRDLRLIVIGTRGEVDAELRQLTAQLALTDTVDIAGFVTDAEYQALVQYAEVIVLASTDEGFGLPVAEASFFGIPVVSTKDSQVHKLHPSHTLAVEPSSHAVAQGILESLKAGRQARSGRGFTWNSTASVIRNTLNTMRHQAIIR